MKIKETFYRMAFKFDSLPLRIKLISLAASGLALTMAVWGFIQLTALDKILVEQQAKRIEGVAETVATFYEHFPTRRGIATLDSALKDFLQSDIRLGRIDIFVVKNKQVEYVAGTSRMSYEWSEKVIAQAAAARKSRYVRLDADGGPAVGLLYPMPGQTKNHRVIIAVVTFTRANTEILARASRLLIVSSAGLIAVIMLLFGLSYGWIIDRPFKTLMDTIDESQKGGKIKLVDMARRDEWGQLADHFNKMADDIQNAMARNLDLTRHLEDRVRQETLKVVSLQKQVDDLKRLTALGHLTANLAHDLGTPLHSIAGLAKLLLEKEGLPPDAVRKLQLIVEQTRRLDHVIQNVRRATRLPEPHFELLTLEDIFSETLPLIEPLMAKNLVNIDVRLDAKDQPFYADRHRLQTAILNIIQNSLDAMPGGGDIRIAAGPAEKRFMKISISDTGRGIDPDVLNRVCEPFFSSHQEEGMRGLGLAIVQDIVKAHGGRLDIESRAQLGTTVHIYLRLPEQDARK